MASSCRSSRDETEVCPMAPVMLQGCPGGGLRSPVTLPDLSRAMRHRVSLKVAKSPSLEPYSYGLMLKIRLRIGRGPRQSTRRQSTYPSNNRHDRRHGHNLHRCRVPSCVPVRLSQCMRLRGNPSLVISNASVVSVACTESSLVEDGVSWGPNFSNSSRSSSSVISGATFLTLTS
ncbi:hypothetical protein CONLIGDRAFT_143313 [Coniochaeta ligniaria NRRL 30616]|uniref:Uncharacterized protein n=1 Tax=Coniochaeta ligniaria NRRL 30616 TaxID=1408157 RepID=A0A1J7J1X1_9PEZI|nr:hypothetical protein CONLIGDRAFT_143313 [Coniochaeta ligniaria NRRL 30616]